MSLSFLRGDDGRSGAQVGARVCSVFLRREGREESPAPRRDCLPTRPASRAPLCQGNFHSPCPCRVVDDRARLPSLHWGRSARSVRAVCDFGNLGESTPATRTAGPAQVVVAPQGVREFTSNSCYSSVRRNRGREKQRFISVSCGSPGGGRSTTNKRAVSYFCYSFLRWNRGGEF